MCVCMQCLLLGKGESGSEVYVYIPIVYCVGGCMSHTCIDTFVNGCF